MQQSMNAYVKVLELKCESNRQWTNSYTSRINVEVYPECGYTHTHTRWCAMGH
jgi:hypothetical protein